ncbi:MAG TPA: ATP-binding cassette domain-containing protein [Bacteroidia bacterium]|jgi:putative ABC transport system ATP-binding protein|nr:ATP-binding cassette domain-containing protein [Bacteroidia bacterium]
MKIEFRNVLPIPLSDTPLAKGSMWKKEIVFDTTEFHLAEAASGTGKTTLLSIIYGIRKDFEGTVLFDGKNNAELSLSDWAEWRRAKFSFLFQDLRLFSALTAKENIMVKNELTHTLTSVQVREYAARLGVEQFLDKPCGKLSLGQQQRIAIVRALAQPFEFLLLDEPFSHLDEENSSRAVALIKEVCEQNKAGLILTSLGPDHYFEYKTKIII